MTYRYDSRNPDGLSTVGHSSRALTSSIIGPAYGLRAAPQRRSLILRSQLATHITCA